MIVTAVDGRILDTEQHVIEDPAVVMDTEAGVLLRAGGSSCVDECYSVMARAYHAVRDGMEDDIKTLKFEKYGTAGYLMDGGRVVFSADEIAALMNYLSGSLGSGEMSELCLLSESALKQRASELLESGLGGGHPASRMSGSFSPSSGTR